MAYSSANGTSTSEKTEVIYGSDKTTKAILEFLKSAEFSMNICADHTWPSVAMGVEVYKKGLSELKPRKVRFRAITDITRDNVKHCKELVQIAELRHLDGIKGNFGISEKAYTASATLREAALLQQVIYSNVKAILEQQQYVFETLWNKAISAEEKIREIEQGLEPDIIEVIQNPAKTAKLYLDLIKNAAKEILLIFPTTNAITRQNSVGALQLLKQAAEQNKVNVRLLMPSIGDSDNNRMALSNPNYTSKDSVTDYSNIKRLLLSDALSNSIDIRHIKKASETKATILIVDRRYSLVIELRDDNESSFEQAIGFSTYSTSRPGILSYISIFESLWVQTELHEQLTQSNEHLALANEQLKIHDRMQREFINIASHEMKTPTQAILGMSGLLKYYPERRDELTEIIQRNAKRLQALTSDILDVTRIESQTLKLEKERFNIFDFVSEVVDDHRERIKDSRNKNIELSNDSDEDGKRRIFVEADRGRITQVLTNLLNNALKFTDEGRITVSTYQNNDSNDNKDEVTVRVVDTGSGIDNGIYPKIFSKFATKSHQGTGLGLFISKSIIEAHGGRIWAKNNTDGRGATFIFTIPIIDVDSNSAGEHDKDK
ncbi:MAG TPA: HAMP domain-containing sensor histidine kinase [Nitrososphaeraceae archaeon]|nr:HAMP domain-containing sensor histidine kinase [Nitrososphaeraceae archaeon]